MEEIIVIRATDPDGSLFRAIIDALKDKRAEVIHAAAPASPCCTSESWRSITSTVRCSWQAG